MRIKEFILGLIGTGMSSVGAIVDVNQVLSIISYVITIVGGILTLIVIPLITWWKRAKEDGKITKEEIDEATQIIQSGVEDLNDKTKDKKED